MPLFVGETLLDIQECLSGIIMDTLIMGSFDFLMPKRKTVNNLVFIDESHPIDAQPKPPYWNDTFFFFFFI